MQVTLSTLTEVYLNHRCTEESLGSFKTQWYLGFISRGSHLVWVQAEHWDIYKLFRRL